MEVFSLGLRETTAMCVCATSVVWVCIKPADTWTLSCRTRVAAIIEHRKSQIKGSMNLAIRMTLLRTIRIARSERYDE